MSLIILALSFLLDVVILWHFFSAMPRKNGTSAVLRWSALALYAPLCMCAGMVTVSYFWGLVAMALIFVVSLTYDMSWRDRVIWSLVLPLIMLVLELIAQLLVSLAVDNIIIVPAYQHTVPYALGLLISKPVCYIVMMALKRFASERGREYKPEKGWLLLVMPAVSTMISIVATIAIDDSGLISYPTFRISAAVAIVSTIIMLLTAVNFVVFLGYERQHTAQEKEHQLASQKQRENAQVEHYTEITERQKTANRTMHDLKNRLYGLREIMEKDPEYAKKTIDEIIENVTLSDLMVKTGIESVDALLGSKYMTMKKKDIAFNVKAFCPKNNHIDIMDLCIVIGNLLDNAIDANESIAAERYINMTMNQVGPVLNITVVNKSAGKTGDSLETTKIDKALHGFGINSIKQIAEKYNGGAAFVPGSETFTAYVSLYNS